MPHQSETIVTVSKATHDAIATHAPDGFINTSRTTFNADGSVSFPLSQAVIETLQAINPDMEVAIRSAVGAKFN